jgi:predicted PurR-regulated permease PerM
MLGFRKRQKDIPEVAITVTTETFIRLALLTVSIIILLLCLNKAAHALLLIFTAFFLALALNGPVYWLSKRLPGKRRGNRTLATSLSFIAVVLLLGGFLASITPPLVRQTENFIKVAPNLVRDFRSQDSETGALIRRYHLEKQVDSFSEELSDRLDHAGSTAFSTVQRVGSSAFAVLTIFVLTFMMLIEGPRWLGFFRDLVPDRHQSATDRLMQDMYKVVKGFVNGQVLLAALASVFILPAILLLNIGYPVALFVIVFICGLIPMIGHTIGAIIVTLVALFESTSAAIIILAYYILYQQIENYLIQPRIQANSTNMSPLLVFMAVVVGVSFGGLFGGLVAIPVAGCLRIALLEYLHHENIISDKRFNEAISEPK